MPACGLLVVHLAACGLILVHAPACGVFVVHVPACGLIVVDPPRLLRSAAESATALRPQVDHKLGRWWNNVQWALSAGMGEQRAAGLVRATVIEKPSTQTPVERRTVCPALSLGPVRSLKPMADNRPGA